MRGDIYRIKASKTARGHEQQGPRYGVVLQADYLPLSTVLVAPTSTSCSPASFRPAIEIDGVRTYVMVEQTAAVDIETRLGDLVGHLGHADMTAIEQALLAVLALD